jgi:hypothetical protein
LLEGGAFTQCWLRQGAGREHEHSRPFQFPQVAHQPVRQSLQNSAQPNLGTLSGKAVEDYRSPRRFATAEGAGNSARSWTLANFILNQVQNAIRGQPPAIIWRCGKIEEAQDVYVSGPDERYSPKSGMGAYPIASYNFIQTLCGTDRVRMFDHESRKSPASKWLCPCRRGEASLPPIRLKESLESEG